MQSVSETCAVRGFEGLKKYHSIENFRIGGSYDYSDPGSFADGGKGGKTLESMGLLPLQIGCIELGTPRRGKGGAIENAVLLCPYYSGDSTNMLDFWHVEGSRTDFSQGPCIGPGLLFDPQRDYIVMPDALGLWGSSRPGASHPGKADSIPLGLDFPRYCIEDCVQSIYRLLKDCLGIDRLKLATGVSFGGTLSYAMSALHPGFVEKAMPIGGTVYQNRGMLRWLFDLVTSAVQSDPVYRETNGRYYHLPLLERPLLGNLFGWSILKQSAFVDEYRVRQPEEDYALEAFDWELSKRAIETMGKEPCYSQKLFDIALAVDSNDLIYRNHCQTTMNLLPHLPGISAATHIFHVDTDQWIRPHIAREAAALIPGAELTLFPHDLGHYAVFLAPNRFRAEMEEFMELGGSSAHRP